MDRQDLPFERRPAVPVACERVSWAAWERLYRHGVAVADDEVTGTSEPAPPQSNVALGTTGP